MTSSPREVVEQVRRMVAGEGVLFADLFAPDGVPGVPLHPARPTTRAPRPGGDPLLLRHGAWIAAGVRDGRRRGAGARDRRPRSGGHRDRAPRPITRHRRALPLPGARCHPGPQRSDRALPGRLRETSANDGVRADLEKPFRTTNWRRAPRREVAADSATVDRVGGEREAARIATITSRRTGPHTPGVCLADGVRVSGLLRRI